MSTVGVPTTAAASEHEQAIAHRPVPDARRGRSGWPDRAGSSPPRRYRSRYTRGVATFERRRGAEVVYRGRVHLVASIPSPSQSVWHLGPLPIRAYALCIVAGIVVAIWLTNRRLVARGAGPDDVWDIAKWAVPFGILGGRIYHVITDPELYFVHGQDPFNALRIWDGGLGIPGAILLGTLGAWIGGQAPRDPAGFLRRRRRARRGAGPGDRAVRQLLQQRALRPSDDACRGSCRSTAWTSSRARPAICPGTSSTVLGYFQPTFLYEAIWDAALAFFLIWAARRFALGRGRVFATYAMGYAFGRFWVEELRSDHGQPHLRPAGEHLDDDDRLHRRRDLVRHPPRARRSRASSATIPTGTPTGRPDAAEVGDDRPTLGDGDAAEAGDGDGDAQAGPADGRRRSRAGRRRRTPVLAAEQSETPVAALPVCPRRGVGADRRRLATRAVQHQERDARPRGQGRAGSGRRRWRSSGDAPPDSRARTDSASPLAAAECSGVQPWLCRASTRAPDATSSQTISECDPAAAACSARHLHRVAAAVVDRGVEVEQLACGLRPAEVGGQVQGLPPVDAPGSAPGPDPRPTGCAAGRCRRTRWPRGRPGARTARPVRRPAPRARCTGRSAARARPRPRRLPAASVPHRAALAPRRCRRPRPRRNSVRHDPGPRA